MQTLNNEPFWSVSIDIGANQYGHFTKCNVKNKYGDVVCTAVDYAMASKIADSLNFMDLYGNPTNFLKSITEEVNALKKRMDKVDPPISSKGSPYDCSQNPLKPKRKNIR